MDKKESKLPTTPSNQVIEKHDAGFVSTMVPINAGKERIRSTLCSIPAHARPPGWRVGGIEPPTRGFSVRLTCRVIRPTLPDSAP